MLQCGSYGIMRKYKGEFSKFFEKIKLIFNSLDKVYVEVTQSLIFLLIKIIKGAKKNNEAAPVLVELECA